MKKIIAIILAAVLILACAGIPAFADDDSTTVEIVMADQGYGEDKVVNSITSGSVTVTLDKGPGSNDPKFFNNSSDLRLYNGGVMTITAGETATVTSIVFTFTSTENKGIGALKPDPGSYTTNGAVGTWTGSAATVTFNNTSGQARMLSIKVTYTGGSASEDPSPSGEPVETTQPELTTPEEILKALYALEQGKTLYGGPYTLTGKITAVNTAYSADHKNVTVTIAVEGFEDYPVQCFRMVGDGADVIGVDYVITVTGTLKDYKGTKEFDANCTLDSYTAPETQPAQPELTTPEEILKALYALEQGTTLYGGPYTLTGKIKAINTVYSPEHKNVTVTMVVEGFEDYPVQCYRLTGDGADIIDVDDNITVTGTLKDYKGTKEFDANCTLDSYEHVEKEKEDVSKLTPEEILNRLYALNNGESLTDEYTLTGKIISVDTAWSDEYNNITVTIEVEGFPDKPVMCYRLAGEGASDLAVNDVITVAGTFKNYNGTYEFNQGCKLLNVVKAQQDNVQTGDNAFVLVFAAVAVVAMAAAVVLKKKLSV